MMDAFLSTSDINLCNGLFRLFLGLLAGGLIGINREKYNRAAGFRTHILICMGSCLIMLISIYIPQEFLNFKNGDPGRIAAQVVTGIGFLGAGAIIKLGDHVKGLTTAASIWVSAAIGMAIGAGMFWISFGAVFLVLLTLVILERLERLMFRKRIFKLLSIQIKQPNASFDTVEQILKNFKVRFDIQEVRQNTYLGITNLEVSITVDSHFPLEKFMNSFTGIPNLQEIAVRSKL